MRPNVIRPLAICIFRKDDAIFVFEGHRPDSGERYYRPLGGGIEYGESGRQTVIRELREEIGAEIADLRYLDTLENIFTYAGDLGHEIAVVYEARFADPTFYERDGVDVTDDGNEELKAYWKSLDLFRRGDAPLYPNGLLDLLDRGEGNL